jgi:hypothetical protein
MLMIYYRRSPFCHLSTPELNACIYTPRMYLSNISENNTMNSKYHLFSTSYRFASAFAHEVDVVHLAPALFFSSGYGP